MAFPSSIFLVTVLALACSCSRQSSPPPRVGYSTNLVSVAGIDANPKVAEHVLAVLSRAGIEGFVNGSVIYDISVRSDAREQAIDALKRDAATNKHRIFF
jgi:hypothetical protein